MKEVILLGRGESWRECLFNREVWATASVLVTPEMQDKHYDKVFAFDPITNSLMPKIVEIVAQRNIPLVSAHTYATEPYPYREIGSEFNCVFFMPTMSYMIAYAIYKGYEKLYLYGVDQGPDWEYLAAKPYIYYWLGVAAGRGVKYIIASTSILGWAQEENIKQKLDELRMQGQWWKISPAKKQPCVIIGK